MHYMYSFPICPVEGPIEPPIPYNHLGMHSTVPQKCGNCPELFEGCCTRYMEQVGHFMALDYGPCGVDGPTDPVAFSLPEEEEVHPAREVPRKCLTCEFFTVERNSYRRIYCRKDADIWGEYSRDFDWGYVAPDVIFVRLPPPKRTTKILVEAAANQELSPFVNEYRDINPGRNLLEAHADYKYIRRVLAGEIDNNWARPPQRT